MFDTIQVRVDFNDDVLQQLFLAINETSMKRESFAQFKRAYEARDVVLSLWQDGCLIAFGTMLSDWTVNSMIYDVVVVKEFQKKGFGKRVMTELMNKAPGTRFYLTSTLGNEDFYRKLGFRKHKTAFALYQSDSPYLE